MTISKRWLLVAAFHWPRYFVIAVALSEIKEIRVGKNTDVLRSKDIGEHYAQECAFSIIYSEQFESMDLIANTPDEANIWVTGLTCLINKNKGGKST